MTQESSPLEEGMARVYIHFRNKPTLQRRRAMERAGIVVRSKWTAFRLKDLSHSYGDTPGYLIADVPLGKLSVLEEKDYVARVETPAQFEATELRQMWRASNSYVILLGTVCLFGLVGVVVWLAAAWSYDVPVAGTGGHWETLCSSDDRRCVERWVEDTYYDYDNAPWWVYGGQVWWLPIVALGIVFLLGMVFLFVVPFRQANADRSSLDPGSG